MTKLLKKSSSFLASLLLMAPAATHAGTPEKSVLATSPPEDLWSLAVTADAGWRQDHFQWTIAGSTAGKDPNILSDLDWTDLEIVTSSLGAELVFKDQWRLRLSGTYGWIVDGDNRDSDYFLNNRRGEFSRSTADTDGYTVDANIELGYDLPAIADRITFTPLVGLGYHRQTLEDTNGVQTVDPLYGALGPFPGLNSQYQANWFGVTFGLESRIRVTDTVRFIAAGRYNLITDYEADGDWNLRSDLKGFKHESDGGDGWLLSAGIEWDFAPRWTLGIHGDWSLFETDHGTDTTRFSDGSTKTRVNEVEWESIGVRAGITFTF